MYAQIKRGEIRQHLIAVIALVRGIDRVDPNAGISWGQWILAMNSFTELPWRALLPLDAAGPLAGVDVQWWIAGGWALEMFRGTVSRPHTDLDVGVLRRDISTVLDHLSDWEVFEAKGGQLTRLAAGALPRVDVHSLWARPTAGDLWTIEVMLDEADGDIWVYRRDPRIRRPLASAIRQSADGICYLAPELQLLYKSTATRERDDADFSQIWPLLSHDGRQWLHNALELVAPSHRWLESLTSSDCGTKDSGSLEPERVFGTRVEGCPYVVRPSAYALVRNAAGQLAIVRTARGGFLPGGGLEPDESPQRAVEREAREECGLVVAPRHVVGNAVEIVYSDEHVCFEKRCVFMAADVIGQAISVEPDHELVWLHPANALAELLPESHRWAVRRFIGLPGAASMPRSFTPQ